MNMAALSCSSLFCATATSTRQHCSSDWLLGEIKAVIKSVFCSECFVKSVLCLAKAW